MAAVSVVFGTTLVLFPFLMRQIPLPEKLRGHKVLVYFSLETVLLLKKTSPQGAEGAGARPAAK